MMKLFKKILFIVFIISTPIFVYAQYAQQEQDQLNITLDPKSPSPFDSVKVTLSSYSFDINNSMIVWVVNGKQYTKGIGMRSIDLNTLGDGQTIPINAIVTTPKGNTVETSINITPQNVDIVWQAIESYTPPFYEGKALPGEGSYVKVTAIPNISSGGKQIPANNLSYSWYLNDNLIEDASGYNKQSAIFAMEYLTSDTNIKVEARSGDGVVSSKTITISPHEVMPLVYTYDDILGVDFSNLITRRLETVNDVTVDVEPFYLSTKGAFDSSVTYSWLLDGLPIATKAPQLLSLHPADNTYGVKSVSINISNSDRILQEAKVFFEVIFDTRN